MLWNRGFPEAWSRLCVCQASFLMTFAMGGVPHAGPRHQYPAKVLLNFPKLNKLLFLCVTFLQALLLVWNTFMYKETVLFLTQPVYPSGIRLSRTPGGLSWTKRWVDDLQGICLPSPGTFRCTGSSFLLKYSISFYVFNDKNILSYLFAGKSLVQYKGICYIRHNVYSTWIFKSGMRITW